jgi:DNA-binding response OmpR family regulator
MSSEPTVFVSDQRAALRKEEGFTENSEFVGERGTILVAEDDECMRDSITAILKHFGYDVIEVANGREAVRIFGINKERLDIVLLDVVMPEMNGKDARDKILAIKPDTRIIFMSGYSRNFFHANGLCESNHHLLEKPIRPDVLLKTIREILDQAV